MRKSANHGEGFAPDGEAKTGQEKQTIFRAAKR
jgi:hypothetical protein